MEGHGGPEAGYAGASWGGGPWEPALGGVVAPGSPVVCHPPARRELCLAPFWAAGERAVSPALDSWAAQSKERETTREVVLKGSGITELPFMTQQPSKCRNSCALPQAGSMPWPARRHGLLGRTRVGLCPLNSCVSEGDGPQS